jgi:anti-sigma regulatory factor (Ser/Thr protein kinase)
MRWIAAAPLRDQLELGAYDRAPGSARGHARGVLAEWGLGHLWDVAEHVISELLTNAYQITEKAAWPAGRPPVRMWLRADARRVCVLAWDAVPSLPAPREAGGLDESGRGLGIVEALSAAWGCYEASPPLGGKVTWALVGSPWLDMPRQAGAAGTAKNPPSHSPGLPAAPPR